MDEPNIYDKILNTLVVENSKHQQRSMPPRFRHEPNDARNRHFKPKSILKKHFDFHQTPLAQRDRGVYSSKHQTWDYTDSLPLSHNCNHQQPPENHIRHLLCSSPSGDLIRKDFLRNQTPKIDSLKRPRIIKHSKRTGCFRNDFNINGYTSDCSNCDDSIQRYRIQQGLVRNRYTTNDPIPNHSLKYDSMKLHPSRNGSSRYKPNRKYELKPNTERKHSIGNDVLHNNSISFNSVIRNNIFEDNSTSSVSTRYNSIVDHSITTNSISSDATLYDAVSNFSFSNESQNAQCMSRNLFPPVNHCHSALANKRASSRDTIYLSSPSKNKALEKYSQKHKTSSPILKNKKSIQQSPAGKLARGGHSKRSYRAVAFLLVYLAVAVALYLTESASTDGISVKTKKKEKLIKTVDKHASNLREDVRKNVFKSGDNLKKEGKVRAGSTCRKTMKHKVERSDKHTENKKDGKERSKKKLTTKKSKKNTKRKIKTR